MSPSATSIAANAASAVRARDVEGTGGHVIDALGGVVRLVPGGIDDHVVGYRPPECSSIDPVTDRKPDYSVADLVDNARVVVAEPDRQAQAECGRDLLVGGDDPVHRVQPSGGDSYPNLARVGMRLLNFANLEDLRSPERFQHDCSAHNQCNTHSPASIPTLL